jgi:DNA-binding NarL/FixJ family response regulator
MKEILRSPFNPYKKIDPDLFTEMELEVITLICEGKTNIEIAQLLFSSLRNIERIRRDVQKKMKVKRTAGLIIYAIKNGLYKGPAL